MCSNLKISNTTKWYEKQGLLFSSEIRKGSVCTLLTNKGFQQFKFGVEGKFTIINARIETVDIKFKSIINNRCVIIVDEFYEFSKQEGRMYRFYTGKPILLAGLYKNDQFLLLTKPSNTICQRLPVVLDKVSYKLWLTEPFDNVKPILLTDQDLNMEVV